MSKIRELKNHLETIEDMHNIVTAMKTLALMEGKKLTRYLADQGKAIGSIRAAAEDFLSFYPMIKTSSKPTNVVLIAIGADRGFCGGFNEEVSESVITTIKATDSQRTTTIAVGSRLCAKLEQRMMLAHSVNGASFAEEVPAVISTVVQSVNRELECSRSGTTRIFLVGHQFGKEGITIVEPIAELNKRKTCFGNPPQLHLAPDKFFLELMDQYFRFVLYEAFYGSLMAENAKRIAHLDTAVHRLEQALTNSRLHFNQARQEEITEEIEILTMNLGSRMRGA